MKTFARLTSLTILAAALAGCANGDLTPELSGLSNRPEDSTNMYEITNNQNVRMISDDFMREWLFDRPSWLSPYPVTATSGMPR